MHKHLYVQGWASMYDDMTCTIERNIRIRVVNWVGKQQKKIVPNKNRHENQQPLWSFLPAANSRHLYSAWSKYFLVFWPVYEAPQLQYKWMNYKEVKYEYTKQMEQWHWCGMEQEREMEVRRAYLDLLYFKVFSGRKTGISVGFGERARSIQANYIKKISNISERSVSLTSLSASNFL